MFRIEAMNINNVLNYFYNIHDLSLHASDSCWMAGSGI